uniref:Uncharacterized protein n=1 Tax=Oryza barthii TaxID=65489 RepID=A0A0D3HC95_9ORYZ
MKKISNPMSNLKKKSKNPNPSKPISEYKQKVSLEIEGIKEKHKMKENAGTISNAESNENSNSMTQDIHQLQDIRGSLKEPKKDKTETNHIQERSSTITQNSGITATQIPQSPALLHDELNMLNSQATPCRIQ